MIPKTIHYIWFGRGKKNKLIEECMKSWKKFCPDYEIKEWNEDNFDINSNQYVKEAYENKKWAFVSDYVRLYALYNEGGIYLDTDCELVDKIDEFLKDPSFSGYESDEFIPTAIMGAEKENEWIKILLDYYDNKSFYNEDGTMDLTTNVITISNITKEKYGVNYDGEVIDVQGVLKIYPKDYFCPKDANSGIINFTPNTKAIHHFNASWVSPIESFLRNKRFAFIKKYGNDIGVKKYNKWYSHRKLFIHIKKYGIKAVVKNAFKKIKIAIRGENTSE